MRVIALTLLAVLVATPTRASLAIDDAYLIGNSLTWDTVPNLLDGDVSYDIFCGKSLEFIYSNGLGATPAPACISSSTPWPTALSTHQYSALVVQPHYDTLAGAAAAISAWWQMQPDAVLVIHEGWGGVNQNGNDPPNETQYHDGPVRADGRANHNPAFFAALIDALRDNPNNPDGEIRLTLTSTMIDQIYHDIEEGDAPYSDLAAIYRDDIHLSSGPPFADNIDGRYLAHNAMRLALSQPISAVGFEAVTAEHRDYLDGVLRSVTVVPESSAIMALVGIIVGGVVIGIGRPVVGVARASNTRTTVSAE